MKPTMSKLISAAAIMSIPLAPSVMKAQTMAVPFSFQVGATVYPAGTYFVERTAGGQFVSMRNQKSKEISRWFLGSGEADPSRSGVILRFDESGQTHLLRSIQYNSRATSRLDGKSLMEAYKRQANSQQDAIAHY